MVRVPCPPPSHASLFRPVEVTFPILSFSFTEIPVSGGSGFVVEIGFLVMWG